MSNHLQRSLGLSVLVAFIFLPILLAALSPLQVGRTAPWVLGTLAGVLALRLLVVQVLLPTGWLNSIMGEHNLGWHRLLGISITGLTLAHILGLYIYSPDDIGDALVLAAPTYSRLGVLSAGCLLLSVGLEVTRRQLQLAEADWKIFHSVLAVAVVGTAVAHTVLLQGRLDGLAEGLVCGNAVVAVFMAIAHWYTAFPRH